MGVFRILIMMLVPVCAVGQTNRYVVYFKDKANSMYSVSQPEAFLSAKSIQRRSKQHITITEMDFPVNASDVMQLRQTGARVFYTSRWMNCALVEVGADSIAMLQSLPRVTKVELAAPGSRLATGRVGHKQLAKSSATTTTGLQLGQLGLDAMHTLGFRGDSVSIALMDAGFEGVDLAAPFQLLREQGQLKDQFDFVGNTHNVYQYHFHGTAVLSIIGASINGVFDGGAPKANFYLYITEDVSSEYRIEEYNWLFAAERADSTGVDIISTSLGYSQFDDPSMNYSYEDMNGHTTVISRAATEALNRGMLVVVSAGNEGNSGWHFITSPADTKGALTCGAVDENGLHVSFSSVGPSSDNRIKPDVVALGSGDALIDPAGDVFSGSGTSFSAPLIASLAAGVWQAFPHLTNHQVYEMIVKSGDQAFRPDNNRGYGLPNFRAIQRLVNDSGYNQSVMLYPNPSSDLSVHVTLGKATSGPMRVTIFNSLGQIQSQSEVNITGSEDTFELGIQSLNTGVYYIRFTTPTISQTVKLLRI